VSNSDQGVVKIGKVIPMLTKIWKYFLFHFLQTQLLKTKHILVV